MGNQENQRAHWEGNFPGIWTVMNKWTYSKLQRVPMLCHLMPWLLTWGERGRETRMYAGCLLGRQRQAGHVVHCSSLGCCVHSVVYVCFHYGMTKYTYAELLWHRNNMVILRWKVIFQFQLYRTKKRPTKRVSRGEEKMQRPGPSADPSGSPKGRQTQNAQARKTEPQKVCWQNGSPKTFMF